MMVQVVEKQASKGAENQAFLSHSCGAARHYPDCCMQTLYESSIAFGMRKALMTEQGKGEMESQIVQMEGSIKDLERQVQLHVNSY